MPRGIDLDAVEQAMLAVPGVMGVHDLRVWALSSGRVALNAPIEAGEALPREGRLEAAVGRMLEERFRITHAVVQVELPGAHPEPPPEMHR